MLPIFFIVSKYVLRLNDIVPFEILLLSKILVRCYRTLNTTVRPFKILQMSVNDTRSYVTIVCVCPFYIILVPTLRQIILQNNS